MAPDPMLKRKAQIAAGVGVICLMFLLETLIAHRSAPHPASPLIWTLLGTAAAVAFSLCACNWRRARRHDRD